MAVVGVVVCRDLIKSLQRRIRIFPNLAWRIILYAVEDEFSQAISLVCSHGHAQHSGALLVDMLSACRIDLLYRHSLASALATPQVEQDLRTAKLFTSESAQHHGSRVGATFVQVNCIT